jgi:hypothetical protein
LLREGGSEEIPQPGPLAEGLAKLFTFDQCDLLLAGGGEWLHLSPDPAPSSLMRYQARTGRQVTNRWHENIDLDEPDCRWVAGQVVSTREAALVRSGLAF